MLRRSAQWFGPLALAITIIAVPVTNSWMKLFQVGLLLVTIVAWLTSPAKWMRIVGALIGLSMMAAFLLPVRDAASRASLPQAYTRSLLRYDGVTYWWGGENALGIDCSGLIRRGMIDASLREGAQHLDGGLLRTAAELWWHDSSAEALGDGYRGWTTPVTQAASLNQLDHSLVRPGDLAIAGGGSHILAYLGDHRWIQADPTAQKVIVETAPSTNGWFKGTVKIVRWTWMIQGP